MLKAHYVVWTFAVAMILGAVGASSQSYPSKPIRIVTAAVGGGDDFGARLIAPGIAAPLGQPVIVDNRGVGSIGVQIVAKAPPDGYTLLVSGASLWFTSLLQETAYDPIRDFSPVALTGTSPNIVLVPLSLPAKSVKELIALAKSRPGALNYGSGPAGSANHLAGELFKAMADVNIVRVPYQGSGAVINAMLGGEVQLMFSSTTTATPHIKSGRLNALAVTSARPSTLAPGLPTLAATGLPGYEMVGIDGVFAPAKTPAAIINRLNQEIVRILNRPDVKERFLAAGVETVGSSPEEFGIKMRSEIVKWSKVIKDAGIRSN